MKDLKYLLVILLALFEAITPAFAEENLSDFLDFNQTPFDISQQFSAIANFADILRANAVVNQQHPSVQDVLSDPQLSAVTDEFGPSVINLSALPIRSEVAVAGRTSWSSWWFPRFEQTLFHLERGDSALEKYDAYRKIRRNDRRLPSAATWERENNFSASSARWEGLCDAWALASILSPEPKHNVTRENIEFAVGDLKGLMLKTFDNIPTSALKFYGKKFTGTFDSFVHPDIFPEQLHRFVEVQLMRNRKPFAMDHDAGVEIWTIPIHKANFLIEADPANPNQVKVRLWLYGAKQLPSVADQNFVGSQEEMREYDYVLRGERNSQGQLVVRSGYWIRTLATDSRQFHPDFLITVPDPAKALRASRNIEIESSLVDELLRASFE